MEMAHKGTFFPPVFVIFNALLDETFDFPNTFCFTKGEGIQKEGEISMEKITSEAAFQVAIQSPRLTVAVFKADWCGDCKFIDPFMPEVEAKYEEQVTLIEVDVDQVGDVSQQQNILGIPSFVAYTDGRELVRFVNKLRKSREEIEDFLKRAIEVYNTIHK